MYNKDATMELQKVDFDYRQNDSLIQQKVYDECATHELLKIVQYPKIASYQKVNTLIKKAQTLMQLRNTLKIQNGMFCKKLLFGEVRMLFVLYWIMV